MNTTFHTVRNDTTNFKALRQAAFAQGHKYEIEVGDSNTSDFAWFASEAEARAAHSQLEKTWEDYAATEGWDDYIEFNAIRLLGTDADGDHDSELDQIIHEA